MQLYLKQVLEAFFHSQSSVRHFALNVIALTLNQGLIHPVQVHWFQVNVNILLLKTCTRNMCINCLRSSHNMNPDGAFCAVCTLPHCNGNRPRAQHEEQSWPAAGGDWQEVHRIHPCESEFCELKLFIYLFVYVNIYIIPWYWALISTIFICRWRRLLGWRCRTVCSRPSICLVKPS